MRFLVGLSIAACGLASLGSLLPDDLRTQQAGFYLLGVLVGYVMSPRR